MPWVIAKSDSTATVGGEMLVSWNCETTTERLSRYKCESSGCNRRYVAAPLR